MRTNFRAIVSSHSESLLSAMDIIIAINTNHEIEISTYICTTQHLRKYVLEYCHFDFTILSLALRPLLLFLSSDLFVFLSSQQYFYSTTMIAMGLV